MNWTYPLAEHVDFSYECAGNSLTDNYAWMEKNDEKTKRYVAEQNLFTTSWFEGTSDVSRRAADLAAKAGKAEFSNIIEGHGRLYASRREPNGEVSAVILDQDFNVISVLLDDEKSKSKLSRRGGTSSIPYLRFLSDTLTAFHRAAWIYLC